MIINFFDELTGTADTPVWVGLVQMGMVVQATAFHHGYPNDRTLDNRFGHIISFARHVNNELILNVQWDNGTTGSIHPSQVKLLVPSR